MSVHNSEHNTPNNSDHDDDIHDSVTRISKLDISDPLHLHPNDTTALTVGSIKLKGTENYQVWSCAMLLALEVKNKIGFIDGSCKRSKDDEVLGKQWDRVNAIILGWILNSISEELFLGQIFSKRAKHVWEELKETYDKVDRSIMFGLHNQINTLKQNGSSIADYYHKLNALWKQYDAMIELSKCVCNASEGFKKHNQLLKLMQFLMGLDDSYMQIRSSILSRETLLDVKSAYATIYSEESHRVARSNQNFNVGPSRSNNVNNNRQGGGSGLNNNRPSGGSGLVCENCDFNGHTIDRCFKIVGYPADFGKKKSGQNFKKQSVSNNNSVGKSLSSGSTDEQMATLISLIKDNKVRKNVKANMAVITEYLVNISKRRAFWSLNEDILKINDSDYQYAVSIKEDTATSCRHAPKDHTENNSIPIVERVLEFSTVVMVEIVASVVVGVGIGVDYYGRRMNGGIGGGMVVVGADEVSRITITASVISSSRFPSLAVSTSFNYTFTSSYISLLIRSYSSSSTISISSSVGTFNSKSAPLLEPSAR
ncbi:ribonuclease H-like domain-containing protein [Tanacetum coccineum]